MLGTASETVYIPGSLNKLTTGQSITTSNNVNNLASGYGIQAQIGAGQWAKICCIQDSQTKCSLLITGLHQFVGEHDSFSFEVTVSANNNGYTGNGMGMSAIIKTVKPTTYTIQANQFWGTYFDLVVVSDATGSNLMWVYAKSLSKHECDRNK